MPPSLPPGRFVGREEALAIVRALPEVKAYGETLVHAGNKARRISVGVHVTREVDEACHDSACPTSWAVAVGASDAWEGDRITEEGLIELHAEISARDGSIRLHDRDEQVFLDEAVWRARRNAQRRATRLILAMPEWTAQARATARTPGHSLGLMLDHAPPVGCSSASVECRWSFLALAVCGGCAGHWNRLGVDTANDTLFVGEPGQEVPYGVWRSATRREEATTPAYRDLVGPKERFPDLKVGNGRFGYGMMTSYMSDVTDYHPPARAVLEAAGLRLVRVEIYHQDTYPVFFVETDKPFPLRENAAAVRAFAARLVQKNGGFACEILFSPNAERYQFDRHAAEPGDAGVYVLTDEAFHPWIGN